MISYFQWRLHFNKGNWRHFWERLSKLTKLIMDFAYESLERLKEKKFFKSSIPTLLLICSYETKGRKKSKFLFSQKGRSKPSWVCQCTKIFIKEESHAMMILQMKIFYWNRRKKKRKISFLCLSKFCIPNQIQSNIILKKFNQISRFHEKISLVFIFSFSLGFWNELKHVKFNWF